LGIEEGTYRKREDLNLPAHATSQSKEWSYVGPQQQAMSA